MNFEGLKAETWIMNTLKHYINTSFKMCINSETPAKNCSSLCFFLGGKKIIFLANIKIHAKLTRLLQSAPIMDFWKWPFMQCVTAQVNENILQSVQSESAPCIKLLSLKRETRLWNIETSRF